MTRRCENPDGRLARGVLGACLVATAVVMLIWGRGLLPLISALIGTILGIGLLLSGHAGGRPVLQRLSDRFTT